jgi:hypothetical protein
MSTDTQYRISNENIVHLARTAFAALADVLGSIEIVKPNGQVKNGITIPGLKRGPGRPRKTPLALQAPQELQSNEAKSTEATVTSIEKRRRGRPPKARPGVDSIPNASAQIARS